MYQIYIIAHTRQGLMFPKYISGTSSPFENYTFTPLLFQHKHHRKHSKPSWHSKPG